MGETIDLTINAADVPESNVYDISLEPLKWTTTKAVPKHGEVMFRLDSIGNYRLTLVEGTAVSRQLVSDFVLRCKDGYEQSGAGCRLRSACKEPRVDIALEGCVLPRAKTTIEQSTVSAFLYKPSFDLQAVSLKTFMIRIKPVESFSFKWILATELNSSDVVHLSSKGGAVQFGSEGNTSLILDPYRLKGMPEGHVISKTLHFEGMAPLNQPNVPVRIMAIEVEVKVKALLSLRKSKLTLLAGEKQLSGQHPSMVDGAVLEIRIQAVDEDGLPLTCDSKCQLIMVWRQIEDSSEKRLTLRYDQKLGQFQGSVGQASKIGTYELWLSTVQTETEEYSVIANTNSVECGIPSNSSSTCLPVRITVENSKANLQLMFVSS